MDQTVTSCAEQSCTAAAVYCADCAGFFVCEVLLHKELQSAGAAV